MRGLIGRRVATVVGVLVLAAACAGDEAGDDAVVGEETEVAADSPADEDDRAPQDQDQAAPTEDAGDTPVQTANACDLLADTDLQQLTGVQLVEASGVTGSLCRYGEEGGQHSLIVSHTQGEAMVDNAQARFDAGANIEREVDLGDLAYVEIGGESRIVTLVAGQDVVTGTLIGPQLQDPATVDAVLQALHGALAG